MPLRPSSTHWGTPHFFCPVDGDWADLTARAAAAGMDVVVWPAGKRSVGQVQASDCFDCHDKFFLSTEVQTETGSPAPLPSRLVPRATTTRTSLHGTSAERAPSHEGCPRARERAHPLSGCPPSEGPQYPGGGHCRTHGAHGGVSMWRQPPPAEQHPPGASVWREGPQAPARRQRTLVWGRRVCGTAAAARGSACAVSWSRAALVAQAQAGARVDHSRDCAAIFSAAHALRRACNAG